MSETIPTPEQENKKPAKKLNQIGQKIKHWFQQAHEKIGVYGWISLGLLILLLGTIAHYEWGQYHRFSRYSMHPIYMRQDNNWLRSIDRDFENMRRQMDTMRARHEAMIREAWNAPVDPRAATTSIVSNGNYQYSVNTRDGKLDGFISASAEEITKLLPQVQKLGLTVEQKDNRLFISGGAKAMNELLKLLR